MTIANMHVHSSYSWDSLMKIDKIVKEALANNIKYVALTDHIELDREPLKKVIEKYQKKEVHLDIFNNEYEGKIRLLNAVEISEPYKYEKEVRELENLNLDYILGSVHKLNSRASKLEDIKNAYKEYYQSIKEMIEFGQIDAVGHLDYLNRYYNEDLSDIDRVKDLLKIAVEKDIKIEINTSGLRRNNIYPTFPSKEKVSLYKALGGTRVVIGSDAHNYKEIGDNLEYGKSLVSEIGLEEGIFVKRKFERI